MALALRHRARLSTPRWHAHTLSMSTAPQVTCWTHHCTLLQRNKPRAEPDSLATYDARRGGARGLSGGAGAKAVLLRDTHLAPNSGGAGFA